jgi:hypothetical protein
MGQQAKLADLAWCQSAQMSSPQTTPGMLLLARPSDLVRSYLEKSAQQAAKSDEWSSSARLELGREESANRSTLEACRDCYILTWRGFDAR